MNNQLAEMTYDFGPYFHSRVMAKIETAKYGVLAFFRWQYLAPLAILVGVCLFWAVIQDGSLNIDSLLGISDMDDHLSEYLIYY